MCVRLHIHARTPTQMYTDRRTCKYMYTTYAYGTQATSVLPPLGVPRHEATSTNARLFLIDLRRLPSSQKGTQEKSQIQDINLRTMHHNPNAHEVHGLVQVWAWVIYKHRIALLVLYTYTHTQTPWEKASQARQPQAASTSVGRTGTSAKPKIRRKWPASSCASPRPLDPG